MPYSIEPFSKKKNLLFDHFFNPALEAMEGITPLLSGCNRPLKMEFEDHLKSLVFFHLQEHTSAQELLQVLEQDEYAKQYIAPKDGIKKSSFSEATNSRGLEQFFHVFTALQKKASEILPQKYSDLGELVAIDGSLIDSVLSMTWADYRKGSNKARVHMGFDINRAIPRKLFLTDGKSGERPFVSQILSEGETGIMDRGYQCHKSFDQWQEEDVHFVCRIKAGTKKDVLENHDVDPDSKVFLDATVYLGEGKSRTQKTVRLVGYQIQNVKYFVATDRYDLTAEQVAYVYKLRWDIESFFGWWKRHLKVYHLIARSEHGLMVQILSGLITYLLLAIYCHKQHNESVSIKRVRELRIQINNELRQHATIFFNKGVPKENQNGYAYAKT